MNERLKNLIEYLKQQRIVVSNAEFARETGAQSSFLSEVLSGKRKLSEKYILKIVNVYPQVNKNWLLTGNGLMLAEQEEKFSSSKGMVLPLINQVAMAGYNEDNWTTLLTQCPLYSIPDIDHSAEFLIPVAGDSMVPKYEPGDLLACKMIDEVLFFQWGKTYVIDSSQGVMVKRVYEDENNSENVLLVSENSKYPPFAIPRSDVRKLALVVGVVRIKLE